MKIQIKMTMIEEIDDEMDLRKELVFTALDSDSSINVRIFDEDTSEDVEINVSKCELKKVLTLLDLPTDVSKNMPASNKSDFVEEEIDFIGHENA